MTMARETQARSYVIRMILQGILGVLCFSLTKGENFNLQTMFCFIWECFSHLKNYFSAMKNSQFYSTSLDIFNRFSIIVPGLIAVANQGQTKFNPSYSASWLCCNYSVNRLRVSSNYSLGHTSNDKFNFSVLD